MTASGAAIADLAWRSVVIGAGGAAAMDLWSLALKRMFGLPLPNWALVGRWFVHLSRGTFFHADIAAAPRVAHEFALGWTAHYLIGTVYAAVLLLYAGAAWAENPTFLPALTIGLVTVLSGWFILQPGMGKGWASSLHPHPARIRALNLASHTVFAVGMFAASLAASTL